MLKITLELNVSQEKVEKLVKELRKLAKENGGIKVTTKIELAGIDDLVERTKKRYFAMVDQLGRFAGYSSVPERTLFKQQVKEELGGESIAVMKTYEEISVKIEELHQLAINQYNYQFPPDV